jgi:hypothetical protein
MGCYGRTAGSAAHEISSREQAHHVQCLLYRTLRSISRQAPALLSTASGEDLSETQSFFRTQA